MKKITAMILTLMLLLSLAGNSCFAEAATPEAVSEGGEQGESENGTVLNFPSMGVTLTFPEEYEQIQGVIYPEAYNCISNNPDVYYMDILYIAMTQEAFDLALDRLNDGAMTEEETEAFQVAVGAEIDVIVVKNGDIGEILEMLGGLDVAYAKELGSADGYTFYLYMEPADEYLESLDQNFSEDGARAREMVVNALENAEFYGPIDPIAALVGTTISFKTTDLDGNEVTSEELFAANEVTMINVWATWCPPCKGELGELAQIHDRLQEKNCGLIGIVTDGSEATGEAKQLLEQNGVAYPNLCASRDMSMLSAIEAIPTSIFVDKSGMVLCEPIVGARVSEYEKTVTGLLG